MTTRLKIYRAALRLCGHTTIASLTEDIEARRLLDEVWDDDGVEACLEAGQWTFATRTVRLDNDTSITPEFGYRYAFQKPSDWRATAAVCSDEYFNVPLIQYSDEQDYWYAEEQIIYVKYISDHVDWGLNLAGWPQKFSDFVSAYFAMQIVGKLTSDENKIALISSIYDEAMLMAKNHNAMSQPTRFPPQGAWVRSRYGNRGSRDDRGSRNQLIG